MSFIKRSAIFPMLLAISCMFAGCLGREGTLQEFTDQYYDLRGLLANQLDLLDSLRPRLTKVADIDEKKETEQLKPDSAGWANELDAFFQADINKPVLRDQYSVRDTVLPASELQHKIYNYQGDEPSGVRYLLVSYDQELQDIKSIEAFYVEKNVLFESSRKLKLQFTEVNDNPRLQSYLVDGFQKMVLKDTVFYLLEAEVIY